MAGKHELLTSNRLDTVNFNLKPKVLKQRKLPDVIRTDRQKTDYYNPLIGRYSEDSQFTVVKIYVRTHCQQVTCLAHEL